MYLKRNDLVMVISGAQKGKTGRILRVIRDKNQVVVQGVNLVYKHLRRSQKNPQGGRIQKESPIFASKVLLVDPKSNEPTRVGFRLEAQKKGQSKEEAKKNRRQKVRYSKTSGDPV